MRALPSMPEMPLPPGRRPGVATPGALAERVPSSLMQARQRAAHVARRVEQRLRPEPERDRGDREQHSHGQHLGLGASSRSRSWRSQAMAGLYALFGPLGLCLGAAIMVLVGNHFSAAAAAPELLPSPWAASASVCRPVPAPTCCAAPASSTEPARAST